LGVVLVDWGWHDNAPFAREPPAARLLLLLLLLLQLVLLQLPRERPLQPNPTLLLFVVIVVAVMAHHIPHEPSPKGGGLVGVWSHVERVFVAVGEVDEVALLAVRRSPTPAPK
jgi:hypothetical protein